MKRGFHYLVSFVAVILTAAILLSCLGGCTAGEASGEGFAIYLINESGSPGEAPDINSIEMGDTPLIGLGDIVCYDSGSHEFILSDSAYARCHGINGYFAVCIDRQPVYTGIFWNWFSSQALNSIVILEKLSVEDENILVIQAGYPGDDFYRETDFRGDAKIMKSLRQAGKLIEVQESRETIPTPFKSWELYSFERDGKWYYTLIFGTNRIKWLDEIIFEDGASDEDGIYHCVGTGEIISLLSRLADDASVVWRPGIDSNTTPNSDITIKMPPDDVVNAISYYAEEFGLDLHVYRDY